MNLPNTLEFEWDTGNFNKSLLKHGLHYWEIEEAFFDEKKLILRDLLHSKEEARYILLGTSASNKCLFIVFTTRNTNIRVISARVANRRERKIYEEKA